MLNDEDLFEQMLGISGIEKLKPKEPIYADRSALQNTAECPLKSYLYKEHDIDIQNIPCTVGREQHKLIEEVLKDGLAEKLPPEDIADNLIVRLPTIRPDVQPQTIQAARHLADMILNLAVNRIMGVEMQIDDNQQSGMVSMDGRPYVLTTCLDLVMSGNNSLIVYDWKSGFKKRTNQEAYNDFQTQFGSFILWELYPDVDTIHWFYIETYWGTKSYARLERNKCIGHPEMTTYIQFQGRIFEALKLWRQDCRDAWPEPKKCSWCDAIKYCKFANPDAKEITDDPRAFIDQLCVLQELVKKNKATANDYLKKFGPIHGSKTVYEWRKPSQKFTPRLYKADGETEEES